MIYIRTQEQLQLTSSITDDNADLMAPIAEILKASDKDLPTKVGVLVDSAAALLATSNRADNNHELRSIAEEMRKRLIRVCRINLAAREERQQNATAALKQMAGALKEASYQPGRTDYPAGSREPGADH